jgi:hypothetical protein
LVRIGPTAWPFTGFIHTYIHTDRQLDKYILDRLIRLHISSKISLLDLPVSKICLLYLHFKQDMPTRLIF